MESTVISSVADLTGVQRQAVEAMVGRALDPRDLVFLTVMQPGQEPSPRDKAGARARLERVFQQSDEYGQAHGVAPQSADAAIDAAVEEVRARKT